MTWIYPGLPYRVVLHNADWASAQAWCNQNVGAFDQDWYKLGIDPAAGIINGREETVWFFRHEADAVAFSLRWL